MLTKSSVKVTLPIGHSDIVLLCILYYLYMYIHKPDNIHGYLIVFASYAYICIFV